MRDERHFHFGVLSAYALQCEEEESLRELALGLTHAAGHVDREYDRCVGCRTVTADELSEPPIIVRKRRRIGLNRAAPDRLFDGAAAVEPRAHTALVPAFAYEILIVLACRFFRLEVR